MPYNSETETFYQEPATVVDSTPDGDTVQEGFDDRLTPALAGVYADFNLLKADGMIGVGIPATTTARGIGRVATAADAAVGSTITNGPAFLDAATWKVSATPANGVIPLADTNGKLDAWVTARPNFYGTCATASATSDKVVTCSDFVLFTGAEVYVTFANSNSVQGPLTLNVNGTGAKSIYDESGAAVSSANPAYFPAGCSIEFVYDGAHWVYIRRIVKAYSGASSWYNIRSDGWINQGLIYANTQTASNGSLAAVTHTLPLAHRDTKYDIKKEILMASQINSLVFAYSFLIGARTINTFQTSCENNIFIAYVLFKTEGF